MKAMFGRALAWVRHDRVPPHAHGQWANAPPPSSFHPAATTEEDERRVRRVLTGAERDLAAINRIAAAANLPQVHLPQRDE